MDTEQEGDSLAAAEGGKDTPNLTPRSDNDDVNPEKLALEGLEDTNEESEISVLSGASAAVSQSSGGGKKKRKRRRNKKRKSEDVQQQQSQQPALSSRVGSNETLPNEDKPVVITTYVCSSSELDKVRKLATDLSTIQVPKMYTQKAQNEANEEHMPIDTEFGVLKPEEIPRVVFLKDNPTDEDETSSAYETTVNQGSTEDSCLQRLEAKKDTGEANDLDGVREKELNKASTQADLKHRNEDRAAIDSAESPEQSFASEASTGTACSITSDGSKKSKNARKKSRKRRKKSLASKQAAPEMKLKPEEQPKPEIGTLENKAEALHTDPAPTEPSKETSPTTEFQESVPLTSVPAEPGKISPAENDSVQFQSQDFINAQHDSVKLTPQASFEQLSRKENVSAASSKCSLADGTAEPAKNEDSYEAAEEMVVNMLSDTAIRKSIEEIVAETDAVEEKSDSSVKSRSSKGSTASKKSKSSLKLKSSDHESDVPDKLRAAESTKSEASIPSQLNVTVELDSNENISEMKPEEAPRTTERSEMATRIESEELPSFPSTENSLKEGTQSESTNFLKSHQSTEVVNETRDKADSESGAGESFLSQPAPAPSDERIASSDEPEQLNGNAVADTPECDQVQVHSDPSSASTETENNEGLIILRFTGLEEEIQSRNDQHDGSHGDEAGNWNKDTLEILQNSASTTESRTSKTSVESDPEGTTTTEQDAAVHDSQAANEQKFQANEVSNSNDDLTDTPECDQSPSSGPQGETERVEADRDSQDIHSARIQEVIEELLKDEPDSLEQVEVEYSSEPEPDEVEALHTADPFQIEVPQDPETEAVETESEVTIQELCAAYTNELETTDAEAIVTEADDQTGHKENEAAGLATDPSIEAFTEQSVKSELSERSLKSTQSKKSVQSQSSAKSVKSKSSTKVPSKTSVIDDANANEAPANSDCRKSSEISIKSDRSSRKSSCNLQQQAKAFSMDTFLLSRQTSSTSGLVSPQFSDLYPPNTETAAKLPLENENSSQPSSKKSSRKSLHSEPSEKSKQLLKLLADPSAASAAELTNTLREIADLEEKSVKSDSTRSRKSISGRVSKHSRRSSGSRKSKKSAHHTENPNQPETAVSLQAESTSKTTEELDTEDEVEEIEEVVTVEEDPCGKCELEHVAAVTQALQGSFSFAGSGVTNIVGEPSDSSVNRSKEGTPMRESTSKLQVAARSSSTQSVQELTNTEYTEIDPSKASSRAQLTEGPEKPKSKDSFKSSCSHLSATNQPNASRSSLSVRGAEQDWSNMSKKSSTSIKSQDSRACSKRKSDGSMSGRSDSFVEDNATESSDKLERLEVSHSGIDELRIVQPTRSKLSIGSKRSQKSAEVVTPDGDRSDASSIRSRKSRKSLSSVDSSQKVDSARSDISRKSAGQYDDDLSENIRDKTYTLSKSPAPSADVDDSVFESDSKPFTVTEEPNYFDLGRKSGDGDLGKNSSNVNVIFKVGAAVFHNPGPEVLGQGRPSATFTEEVTEHVCAASSAEKVEKYDERKPSIGDLWMMGGEELDAALEKVRKMSSTEALQRNAEDIQARRYEDPVEEPAPPQFDNTLQERPSVHFRIPDAPNPSVANEKFASLTVKPPSLHPQSLARIALFKRTRPELVEFATGAVDNVLAMAQHAVDKFDQFGPVLEADNRQLESDKINNNVPASASEAEPAHEHHHRMVISSDKTASANLSASSSAVSVESTIQLPKVPNPSIENHGALQLEDAPQPALNISTLVSRFVDLTKEKEMKDASCAGGQKDELEPREMNFDLSQWTAARPGSAGQRKSELPSVPSHMLEADILQDDRDGYDELASESASTISSEKLHPDVQKKIEQVFSTPKPSETGEAERLLSAAVPPPPAWVIDPKVIEDAVTESELTDDGPSKTSFIQSIFNCFGRSRRTKRPSKVATSSTQTRTRDLEKARKLSLRRKK